MASKSALRPADSPDGDATRKPGSRAERGERSRERILAHAIELFAERGYDGVSLDDITARSGVKRSLILYYYKNKDELWRAAAEHVARAFNSAVQRNLAKVKGADEAALHRGNLEAWMDSFQEEPDFARLLVREGGARGPRLEWLVQHFGYSDVQVGSAAFRRRMKGTILRDAMMAVFLAFAALGPLMETSLSYASGTPQRGVYPLSKKNRRELIDLLLRFGQSVMD